MNEEAIIRKLNEISQWLKAISDNSKPIHQLPTVEGDELWVAVSNENVTGKKKLEKTVIPDLTIPYKWHNVDLKLGTPINISTEKLNFNLVPEDTNIILGFNGEIIPDGIIGSIRNGSDTPILIKNNYNEDGANIPFFLSSQTDYNLQPNEILSYKYSAERNQAEMTVYSQASFQRLRKKSEVHSLTPAQIEQPSIIIHLQERPNLEEFVDIYINGVFVNTDDFIVEENVVIIAKSNVEYEITNTMKVTINYRY